MVMLYCITRGIRHKGAHGAQEVLVGLRCRTPRSTRQKWRGGGRGAYRQSACASSPCCLCVAAALSASEALTSPRLELPPLRLKSELSKSELLSCSGPASSAGRFEMSLAWGSLDAHTRASRSAYRGGQLAIAAKWCYVVYNRGSCTGGGRAQSAAPATPRPLVYAVPRYTLSALLLPA
jgi:hypothetical protein